MSKIKRMLYIIFVLPYVTLKVFVKDCKRIIRWLPTLWHDRDYDYSYILIILKKKIQFQREYIGKHDRHVRAQSDCKNMRIAEILIDRILKDDYIKVQRAELEEKWGQLEFGGPRGLYRTKVITEKDREQELKDSRRMYDHDDYMMNQDLDYLFKHLRKHIRYWWD